MNQQLEESERLVADFGKRNIELEEELRMLRNQVQEKDGGAKAGAVSRTDFKLRWREGEKAPCEMRRYSDAVIHNGTVYCRYDTNDKVYAYHISSSSWSLTPDTPYSGFALAVIDGLLTAVGGYGYDGKNTNKLLSLTGEGSGNRPVVYTPLSFSKPGSCSSIFSITLDHDVYKKVSLHNVDIMHACMYG